MFSALQFRQHKYPTVNINDFSCSIVRLFKMATESVQVADDGNLSVFKELESYPWETDAEFQVRTCQPRQFYPSLHIYLLTYLKGGLTAILGSNSTPDRVRELTLRAQCFYFSRKKNAAIDFDAYKAYLEDRGGAHSKESASTTRESSDPTPSSYDAPSHTGSDLPSASNLNDPKNAPYPQSFADIVALITSGAPIPGIREIPDTLLTDQASKPVASKRRKPWEKDVDEETIQGGTGTFGDHRDTVVPQEYPIDA
jgi:hypothetical protein